MDNRTAMDKPAAMDKPTAIKPILEQNAFQPGDRLEPATARLVEKRLATLGPTTMLFYRQPLEIVRGEGMWLFDSQGRRYLDAYNNVQVLGHCHPAVVEAVSRQLGQLNIHTRYLDDAIHHYAEQLLASLPVADGRLVLTCTGSEANDLALRLARQWTGRQGVIVSAAAYHGNTERVTEVSPSSYKTGQPPPWVETISLEPLNDPHTDARQWLQQETQRALCALARRGYDCAALLIDSIFSSDGIYADPPGFLQPAVELVRAAGGVLIADEVQPGFGRTGEALWGFVRHDLQPEIVTFGKPMGNGFPVAGLVAQQPMLARLAQQQGYFNTFGGSSAAIAAAQAVWDTLEKEQLQRNAAHTGAYFKQQLQQRQQRWPVISQVRGSGLFIGVDLSRADQQTEPDPQLTGRLINALREQGVLIGAAGRHGATLKIRPPLCFNQQHADLFLSHFDTVMSELLAG